MGTRLANKAALITGAGSGMGRAAAELFVAEGAQVALVDIDLDAVSALAAELGPASHPVQCDIADEESVARGVQDAASAMGQIDALYNNAGVDLGGGRGDGVTHELSTEAFDRTFDVNARGMFYVSRQVIPHLLAAGGGSIINVASVSGALIGSTQHAYATTKGAVIGLTRSLALSYAKHGIRCNAICPGIVRTPMIEFLFGDEAQRARFIDGTPLGRIAEPYEIAPLVLYLASDESSFMTGSVIAIDGGLTTA